MARGELVINHKGCREVLNSDDAYRACDTSGRSICSAANMAGHGTYEYDTQRGRTRIHTRVKTADAKSFYQERATHVLARVASHFG